MSVISTVFSILGLVLICLGVIVFIFEVIGIYKYNFVLNRMHAAGMGDTLGLFLCLVGVCFLSGINYTTLKFIFIIAFLWLSSPTSSHLLSGLQVLIDDDLEENVRVDVEDVKKYVDGREET